jgi:mRNA interferase MazF
LGLRRGDVVVAVAQGAYGKPRPFVVIQSEIYHTPSVTLAPTTSTLEELAGVRVRLEPTPQNGLREVSLVMCDKAQTIPRDKVSQIIGRLRDEEMRLIDSALVLFLGLA